MRRTSITVMVLMLVLSMLLAVEPAAAGHAPPDYCSKSGDICASVEKVNGVRRLRLLMFDKYFDSYRLCVGAPDGSKRCKDFDVKAQGDFWGGSVAWKKHFPDKGPGRYTARWWVFGGAITPLLGWHKYS
jgi:hypothetical protein